MNWGRLRSKNGVCLFRPTPFATHSSVITRTQNLRLKCTFIFVLIIVLSVPNIHIFCREGVFLLVSEKSCVIICVKNRTTVDINSTDWDLSTPNSKKKSPLEPTHYVPLKYSYLSEWWWRERCHWKNEAIQSGRPRFPRNHQLEHLWRLLWSLC